MHVNIGQMRSGADHSYRASEFAKDAIEQLSCVSPHHGMFGSFQTAAGFQTAITDVHSNYVQQLSLQHTGLAALGDKTHHTAAVFTAMEERNQSAMRAVLWPATPA